MKNNNEEGSSTDTPDKVSPKKTTDTNYTKDTAVQLDDPDAVDFETAFDATGFGRINYYVLLMSGLVLLNSNIESMGMGFVMIPAGCDLDLEMGEKGLISSGTFIGLVAGSFIAGYLSDVVGRKTVMLPNLILGPIFTLMSALATNKWLFFVLRIASGLCMSGSSGTIYTYLGEMFPARKRDKAIAMASMFIAIGFGLQAIISWIVIPHIFTVNMFGVSYRSWRLILVSWTIPALAAGAMFTQVPDSPRFLMASNKPEAALAAMAHMYAWNQRAKPATYPIRKLIVNPDAVQKVTFTGTVRNICVTFRPPLLVCSLLAYSTIFCLFFTGSGLYVWLPVILNESLQQMHAHRSLCYVMEHKNPVVKKLTQQDCNEPIDPRVYPFCFLLFITFGFMYVLTGCYSHKFQKRTFFCIVICVCATNLFISVFVPHLILSILLFIIAITMGSSASLIVGLTVEAMPAKVRSTVVCALFVCARFGGIAASPALGVTIHRGCRAYLATTAVLPIVMSLITWFCWPNPLKVRQAMEEKGFVY